MFYMSVPNEEKIMATITCCECNRTHPASYLFTAALTGERMFKATCTDGLDDIYPESEVEG